MKKFLGMLQDEFQGYSVDKFTKDLMAGITVAAVALPLALAFGVSSGADAAAGMITAVIAGLVISFFSGGFYQISGPTGAMAAILMGISASYGMTGVFLATFLAGVMLLVAGIFKLGVLTSFIPTSVITGFTSGIAIIIALGQLDNLLGTTSTGSTALEKLFSYREGITINYWALGLSVLTILFLVVFPKKWNQKVPASLVVIILTTALMMIFQLPVTTVGKIPATLISDNRLTISNITLTTVQPLLFPAFSIALLGMIESLLCGASAGRMTGKTLDSNQELVAQGIGNLLLPFFGGIPATAAIARTSVAIKSGAVTRLTGIIHAITLLISMFLLAPVMSNIPLAALAGVLIVTAWRMNEWHAIRQIFSQGFKSEIALFLLTMISTVVFDLSIAIALGVLAGILIFVIKSASFDISVEEVDFSRLDTPQTGTKAGWCVVYITGPLFFMSAEQLRLALDQVKEEEMVIFSLRGVPSIDTTALSVLQEFSQERDHQVIFSSLQPTVEKMFDQTNLKEEIGPDAFYFSVDQALKAQL